MGIPIVSLGWMTTDRPTRARDSEWQWHQLGQAGPYANCTSPQTDNNARTPALSFLQARCPSCHPTNSIKALKAQVHVLRQPNCRPVSDTVMQDQCQILPHLILYPIILYLCFELSYPYLPSPRRGEEGPRESAPSVVDIDQSVCMH